MRTVTILSMRTHSFILSIPLLALIILTSGCRANRPVEQATRPSAPAETEVAVPTPPRFDGPAATSVAVYSNPLDLEASTVSWSGKKVVGAGHHGKVALSSGGIVVDEGKILGGSFTIDMTSIVNEDLSGASKERLENHLKNEDFFDVASFPTAIFTFSDIAPRDDETYTITGDLTIKGVTIPITFPATITEENGIYTGDATIVLDRTKWGVNYGSGNIFKDMGDKAIEDEMTLDVHVVTK